MSFPSRINTSLLSAAVATGLMLSSTHPAAGQESPTDEMPVAPAVSPEPATVVPEPSRFVLELNAARQLAIDGQRDEAITAYDAMLAEHPGNVDVLLGRGRTHAWMKNWAEAERDLVAVTQSSPEYADAWSALGDMYLWSDRPEQSVGAYDRWVALRPDDASAKLARGRAHRSAGHAEQARSDFTAAAEAGAEPNVVASNIAALDRRVQDPDRTVPEGYNWSARLSAGHTGFSPDRDGDWNNYDVSIRRHFDRGSLAGEFLTVQRFGKTDHAFAADAYGDLWQRAYANFRFQYSPDASLFPEYAWRAELFQGVGKGWELSASYDNLHFSSSDVDIYGVGVGKYVGNFYVRGRALYIPGGSGSGVRYRALGRYYYNGDADSYVEINAGTGRSSENILRGSGLENGRVRGIGAAWSTYVTPNWGFKISADYSSGDSSYTERGIQASIQARW